jgi:hypothetical protein
MRCAAMRCGEGYWGSAYSVSSGRDIVGGGVVAGPLSGFLFYPTLCSGRNWRADVDVVKCQDAPFVDK